MLTIDSYRFSGLPTTEDGYLDFRGARDTLRERGGHIAILQSGIGSGKTQAASEWAADVLASAKDVVVVTPGQALTSECSARYGVRDYQDMTGTLRGSVAVCANSLPKYEVQAVGLFVIEECEQMLQGLLNGTYDSRSARKTYEHLHRMIEKAEVTLLIDAHPGPCTARLLARHQDKVIRFKGWADKRRPSLTYCSTAVARVHFQQAVARWLNWEGPVYVYSHGEAEITSWGRMVEDSCRDVQGRWASQEMAKLKKLVCGRKAHLRFSLPFLGVVSDFRRRRRSPPKVLVVTASTYEKEFGPGLSADARREATVLVKARIKQADFFLASPKMATGLDLYMKATPSVVFGLAYSIVGTASSIHQGMGRVRNGLLSPAVIGGALGGGFPDPKTFEPEYHLKYWTYKDEINAASVKRPWSLPADFTSSTGQEYMLQLATAEAARLKDGLTWTTPCHRAQMEAAGHNVITDETTKSDKTLNEMVADLKVEELKARALHSEGLPRLSDEEIVKLLDGGATTRDSKAQKRWYGLADLLGPAFLQAGAGARVELLVQDRPRFRQVLHDFAHVIDPTGTALRDAREAIRVDLNRRTHGSMRSNIFRLVLKLLGVSFDQPDVPLEITEKAANALADWAEDGQDWEWVAKQVSLNPTKKPPKPRLKPGSNADLLNRYFGIQRGTCAPMRFAGVMLRKLGLGLEKPVRGPRGEDGKRPRIYRFDWGLYARQLHLSAHYRANLQMKTAVDYSLLVP